MTTREDNNSEQIWNARQAALASALGPSDGSVIHSPIPFYLDGAADVLRFRQHINGIAYVTADLIGDDRSKPSKIGQYELMICLPDDADWAPLLISNLAKYTIDSVLSPGDTMDIGPALPKPTTISAFLYLHYATITVQGKSAGIVLCIGITADELAFVQQNGSEELVKRLKQRGIYPLTVLRRRSVLNS